MSTPTSRTGGRKAMRTLRHVPRGHLAEGAPESERSSAAIPPKARSRSLRIAAKQNLCGFTAGWCYALAATRLPEHARRMLHALRYHPRNTMTEGERRRRLRLVNVPSTDVGPRRATPGDASVVTLRRGPTCSGKSRSRLTNCLSANGSCCEPALSEQVIGCY